MFHELPANVSGQGEIEHVYLKEKVQLVQLEFARIYWLASPMHLCSKHTTVEGKHMQNQVSNSNIEHLMITQATLYEPIRSDTQGDKRWHNSII